MISSLNKKRKRAENPSVFLTLPLVMVLALTTIHPTSGDLLPQQCVERDEVELRHVEESCNSKGILIYAKTADLDPELCYKMESCGTGIFKASTEKGGGWGCEGNCQPCPAWAADCSQYTASDLWPNKHVNTDLSVIEPPKKEGGRPTVSFTHQIELFDGTKHSVRQLQIRTIDMFDESPICTGRGTTIGTPQFCSKNECATSGTRFCFYPRKEVTLYVGNGGELPLKAWGNVQNPQNPSRKPKKPPICLECHLKCALHGVEFFFDRSPFKQMEVCCGPYCYHGQKKLPPAHFILPKDVLLSEHLCSVQLWTDDGTQFREKNEQRCPAKNIFICWTAIFAWN